MSQCSELFTTWDDEYDKLQVFKLSELSEPYLYFFSLQYGEVI